MVFPRNATTYVLVTSIKHFIVSPVDFPATLFTFSENPAEAFEYTVQFKKNIYITFYKRGNQYHGTVGFFFSGTRNPYTQAKKKKNLLHSGYIDFVI